MPAAAARRYVLVGVEDSAVAYALDDAGQLLRAPAIDLGAVDWAAATVCEEKTNESGRTTGLALEATMEHALALLDPGRRDAAIARARAIAASAVLHDYYGSEGLEETYDLAIVWRRFQRLVAAIRAVARVVDVNIYEEMPTDPGNPIVQLVLDALLEAVEYDAAAVQWR